MGSDPLKWIFHKGWGDALPPHGLNILWEIGLRLTPRSKYNQGYLFIYFVCQSLYNFHHPNSIRMFQWYPYEFRFGVGTWWNLTFHCIHSWCKQSFDIWKWNWEFINKKYNSETLPLYLIGTNNVAQRYILERLKGHNIHSFEVIFTIPTMLQHLNMHCSGAMLQHCCNI